MLRDLPITISGQVNLTMRCNFEGGGVQIGSKLHPFKQGFSGRQNTNIDPKHPWKRDKINQILPINSPCETRSIVVKLKMNSCKLGLGMSGPPFDVREQFFLADLIFCSALKGSRILLNIVDPRNHQSPLDSLLRNTSNEMLPKRKQEFEVRILEKHPVYKST